MRCAKRLTFAFAILSLCGASSRDDLIRETLTYGKKYAMGTVFEIAAYDHSPEHASEAIEKAFQEIVRLDDLLSNYKPDSALSRLNHSAHFHAETVPTDLYIVIDKALHFSRLTAGKFDLSVAPQVTLWKAALAGDNPPSRAQLQEIRNCIGYEKIELTPPERVTFHSPCLQLDLGAIGKGYAVDRAAEVLHRSGIRDALISAGGSTILAMGSPPGQAAWTLHLRDPSHRIGPLARLKDESLSTSEQTPPTLLGRDSAGHIIDPDSGTPLVTDFSVNVIAKTGIESDALSTSLLLLGPDKGRTAMQNVAGFSAIWISPDARMEIIDSQKRILLGN